MSSPPFPAPPAGPAGTCYTCTYSLAAMPPGSFCPECGRRAEARPAAMPEGPIGAGAACVNCGYSLQGLHPAGVCPECGTPCEHSLRGNLLAFAGEAYVRSLRVGVGLILNAILLQVLFLVVMIVVPFAMVAARVALPPYFQLAVQGASVVLTAMQLYGWWRFSEPDPGYVGQHTGADARQVVRLATIAQAGLAVVGVGVQLLYQTAVILAQSPEGMAISIGLGVLSVAVAAVQFFASMRYLRWLAPRLPDRVVHDRARRYTWLLPLIYVVGAPLLFLGPLIAMVMYWNLLDLVRKHLKRIIKEREGAGIGRPAGAG